MSATSHSQTSRGSLSAQVERSSSSAELFPRHHRGGFGTLLTAVVWAQWSVSGGREVHQQHRGGQSLLQLPLHRRHQAEDQRHGQQGRGERLRVRGLLPEHKVRLQGNREHSHYERLPGVSCGLSRREMILTNAD